MALFTFKTVDELTDALCDHFTGHLASLKAAGKKVNLAFSGGSTPGEFFDKLAVRGNDPRKSMDWGNVHIFWVDERCVPPEHQDSNYGMTERRLLRYVDLNAGQVHRIRGESDPAGEAARYSAEILLYVPQEEGMPVFDMIFLGVGVDGHTASIFPGRMDLFHSASVCESVRHPDTGQYRITLTGPVLLHARILIFLVTGSDKSTVVRSILNREPGAENYPACYLDQARGDVDWYLDRQAAMEINT